MKRFKLPIYKYPVDGKWQTITEQQMMDWEKTNPSLYEWWDDFIYESQLCPIRNFLPHGMTNQCTTRPNEGLQMMNDWKNDLVLLLAGNQLGKTTLGCAFTLLHGAIPLDPTWPCFTKHDIQFKEWTGPKKVIIASWSRDTASELWRNYLSWIPREELGAYSPNWGRFEGEKGRQKTISFGDGQAKMIALKCGTEFTILYYTQAQGQWEGRQCDLAHCDEQPPEDKMDGLIARQLTRGDYCPIIMTLTGHVLPGRPDTGAGGWIKTKLIDQNQTKGRKFRVYRLSIDSTPDAIMSKEKKKQAYIQWVVEPEASRSLKKINEGKARYWGGWEVGGGIILNEWNPDFHWIEPFDINQYRPTLYRMVDHGYDPCACLLFAKLPWGDTVVFKEYYEYGRNIEQNCEGIVVDMCGNQRMRVDEYSVEGQSWAVYQEEFSHMKFAASELDAVSFGSKAGEQRKTIGSLYNQFGLTCKPANAQKDNILIPLLKEHLAIDPKREHINLKLGRPWPKEKIKFGAPRLYVFNTCKSLRTEIEGWIASVTTGKPTSHALDHLISCCKFFIGRERPYFGASNDERNGDETGTRQGWRI